MNIKELLTKPHFSISEYLGEFIAEEEEYKSIRIGALLELDENVSQDIFIQTISLFIEEWASVIDLFEKFVDEFYAKAHTSCWIHNRNLQKINKEGANFIDLSKIYLTTHFIEEHKLLHIKQLLKTFVAAYNKFNCAIERFNKYLIAYSKILKTGSLAKNIDTTEVSSICESSKLLAVVMNEMTNIIDEHNISKFNNESLREFYDIWMDEIELASNFIESIESGGFEDAANLLDSLKTNSAKLKLMAFQLRQYMCQC